MGLAKKLRKKFQTPTHPWQKERIVSEKEMVKEYGLKNKHEVWVISTKLTKVKNQTKEAIASSSTENDGETAKLLSKLKSLGLINETSVLTDVLKLSEKDFMERRLQTIVFRKGLARSITQARQFITHKHIYVAGKCISSPSYMVRKSEEDNITFNPNSTLSDTEHPERNLEIAKSISVPKKTPDKTAEKTSENNPTQEDSEEKSQGQAEN